jgi:peptide/nickel transport system permease protein
MLTFVIRRIVIMVPLMILISIITFVIIQLPPGDYLTTYVNNLRTSGIELDEAQIEALTVQFGLDKPLYEQYYRWIHNIVVNRNLGWSFQWNSSVNEVLAGRLPITIALSLSSLIVVWIVAIPIAVISATHQYSVFDYFFTFIGFIGIATPSFLLALVAVWVLYALTGYTVTGLFAKEFLGAAWSWAKFVNMMSNAWLPIVIVAVAGTAGLIRVLRATLLDELRKQYVITARSKGLTENRVLFKYPIRIAMNPIFSTIGWLLPSLVSGQVIVAIVLNLQTVGPVLLRATLAQDMYLTGSIVLILSSLTVIGTFISDLLLAWLDPRIRLG